MYKRFRTDHERMEAMKKNRYAKNKGRFTAIDECRTAYIRKDSGIAESYIESLIRDGYEVIMT